MTVLFYIITDIFHIISIFLLCTVLFKFKLQNRVKNRIYKLIITTVILILSISIYLMNNLIAKTILSTLVIVVILCFSYDEKKLNIVVSGLWIMTIIAMLETMSIILLELIGKLVGYNNDVLLRLCVSVFDFFLIVIFGKIYNKQYRRSISSIGICNILAFTALTCIDTIIVMFLAVITRVEKQVTNQMVFFIAFILVILGLFLQLGAVILILVQRNVYKEGQQITEKYLEEQKGHYQYLEQREIETKKFRHDLRSHMGLLSVLVKEHKYDEFDKYVDKINIKIDSFGNNVTVQNGIVDAVINKYYSEATANNVNMEVKGRFPSDCEIDAYDLCTIFSNVLSNAIEATVESTNKWMSVDCRYTDDNIIVVVKNSFDNTNQVRNGKANTHKKDINNHGFGLENVKESIKKYNGIWDIDIQEDVYSITISFNYDRLEGNYEDSDN